MKIKCDAPNVGCGEIFELEHKSHMIGRVEKLYFVCPYCSHEYIVSFTDDKCRAMQRKIGIMKSDLSKEMDKLKAKYQHGGAQIEAKQ